MCPERVKHIKMSINLYVFTFVESFKLVFYCKRRADKASILTKGNDARLHSGGVFASEYAYDG